MTCFSRDNPSVMQKTARLLTEADYKSQKEQCSLQRRFKESSRGGEGEDLSERLATREREKEEAGRKINPLHYYPDQQQYEQKIDQEGWSLNWISALWLDLRFWRLLFTSLYLQGDIFELCGNIFDFHMKYICVQKCTGFLKICAYFSHQSI